MPMSPIKIVNTARPSVMSVGAVAPKVASSAASEPNSGNDLQVMSLDQLKVVEGVYRREQINSPDELVLGDVFQLFKPDDQLRAGCHSEIGLNLIEVFIPNRFGPFSFVANITHSVIFLSETGQQLNGNLLDGSRNAPDRPSVIFYGEISTASNYVLIGITERRTELDCPAPKISGVAWASKNARALVNQQTCDAGLCTSVRLSDQ